MDDSDVNIKPILKVEDILSTIKKDIQIIKSDLSYIKNKLKENREAENLKEDQTKQDGWFLWK
tara:strand:+ start:47 stop:235 length:189 start_codon:yes stop_codon:yes gene_type:complete